MRRKNSAVFLPWRRKYFFFFLKVRAALPRTACCRFGVLSVPVDDLTCRVLPTSHLGRRSRHVDRSERRRPVPYSSILLPPAWQGILEVGKKGRRGGGPPPPVLKIACSGDTRADRRRSERTGRFFVQSILRFCARHTQSSSSNALPILIGGPWLLAAVDREKLHTNNSAVQPPTPTVETHTQTKQRHQTTVLPPSPLFCAREGITVISHDPRARERVRERDCFCTDSTVLKRNFFPPSREPRTVSEEEKWKCKTSRRPSCPCPVWKCSRGKLSLRRVREREQEGPLKTVLLSLQDRKSGAVEAPQLWREERSFAFMVPRVEKFKGDSTEKKGLGRRGDEKDPPPWTFF